jgi:uncharacterized protein (AIM24 family)
MRCEIKGTIAQTARLDFDPDENCWASKGSLVAYSSAVEWSLKIPGGLGGALQRSLSGEGLALARLHARTAGQYALLASNEPGHIETWDLSEGPVLTTRGAFLAAWGPQIDITASLARKAGAAVFGGAGLVLQKVRGSGLVLVHGSGDFVERRLAPGEQLLVSTGNLAAFAEGVDYDIQTVGGVGKALFGQEGLFMTRLTGPGRVLLQTLKRGHNPK